MNKKINFAVLTLASALFTGVLVNGSPLNVNARDEFIVDLHHETFLKVEAGHDFTVVLSTNNEVFTFGKNDRGQLGNGTITSSYEVFNITESFNLNAGETIVDIAAGWGFTVASTSANRIFAWGDPQVVQLAKGLVSSDAQTTPFDLTSALNPSNAVVRKISAGDSNIMVWTNTNVVRMAGGNNFGQLGQGNTTSTSGAVSVNWGSLLSGQTLKDVGIFAQTAYALTESGKVFAWGDNASKQVGNNGGSSVNSPVELTFSGLAVGEKVVSASIGVNHGVAVTSAYKIFFWGTNSNYALGNSATLPLDTVKNTPFNATDALKYDDDGYLSGFVTRTEDWGDDGVIDYQDVRRPLEVFAGNDATIFHAEYLERYYVSGVPQPYNGPYNDSLVIGKNSYDGQEYLLTDYDDAFLDELKYAYWNTYNELDDLADFGFSRTNTIWLNEEGDFTIYGSNVYGQHGFGDATFGGDYYNTNFSSNVRDFMGGIYDYLPTNLTAPLDDYFYPANADFLSDEYYAVFGYWTTNWWGDRRTPGLIDYFFPEGFNSQNEFTDREWSVFLPEEMLRMREIIATLFEDEILYESWISTDEKILEELNNDREEADYIRYDMEFHSNYGGYYFSDSDEAFITDQAIIDLLPTAVETRLDRYRELLAQVEAFEDTYLQPFLALMEAETNDAAVDIDFVYFDEYYDGNALDLDYEQIEYLIDNDYESMILDIFTAYDALPELVQLLINEWNFYGIYEELYYAYHYYYTDAYSDELYDFMDDIQDGEWDWYWPLFENLTDLEALLEKINQLPEVSREWFTETFEDQFGEVYYDYYSYEYWIWLNDLLPYLQEGMDVYDQIVVIEDLIQDEGDGEFVDVEDAAGIIAMYNDFLALSEEAQELLDPEYVYYIYSLALEALANEVDDQLWNLYDIEDEDGTYGLFANYDDVLAAIAAFEDLPEDAIEFMDEDAIAYYEYLLGIQPGLEEGMDVYEDIIAIEAMDLDNLSEETIEAISDMYQAYLLLSEDAQDLLDPEYVEWLTSLVVDTVEGSIEELPGTVEDFDALFNDAETKEATVNGLLGAWNQYQAMSDELRDAMDPEARAHLEALYARYLELNKVSVDLWMIGLILVHLSAGVYFAFKKRDILVKPVQ